MIAVGEDATRVICRVEYDKETDWLVGFVLPCEKAAKPVCDSFVAVSFKSMEECFRSTDVAKYMYLLRMFQLSACVAWELIINLQLNVLKRWTHIFLECKERGITLLSFEANGDSRELKAMQVSTQ